MRNLPHRLILIPVWLIGSAATVGITALLLFTSTTAAESFEIWDLKIENSSPAIFGALPAAGEVLGQSVGTGDARAVRLSRYLAARNSPLKNHVETLINTADKYALPWTLLPAISGKESGYCRVIPEASHNCWGWAIYSGQNSGAAWDSYDHAIETVAKGLRENYFDNGLDTVRKIETRYTPQSAARDNSWANDVETIMQEIADTL